jgi:hypothetical protein
MEGDAVLFALSLVQPQGAKHGALFAIMVQAF